MYHVTFLQQKHLHYIHNRPIILSCNSDAAVIISSVLVSKLKKLQDSPRQAYKIDTNNPGSDLAGETAASMATASIVFRQSNLDYSNDLLGHAKQVICSDS